MIYNDILLTVVSFLNVIGTIYAVLSIIKIKPKEIYHSITWGGIADRDKEIITQFKQARMGISLVCISWVLEVVLTFYKITSLRNFIIMFIVILAIVVVTVLLVFFIDRHFENVYKRTKEEKMKNN